MTAWIATRIGTRPHFALGRALIAEHLRQLLHLLIEEAQWFVVGHLWQRLGLEQLQERGEVHLGGIFPNAVEIDPHGIMRRFRRHPSRSFKESRISNHHRANPKTPL
jgi:hypothetical protein